jgi:hypothetical protein
MNLNYYILTLLNNIAFNKDNSENLSLPDIFNPLENNSISNYACKETSAEFYNTPLKNLDYDKSLTFFTKRFEEDITMLMASNLNVKELQHRLNNLCQREYEWKSYNKKIIHDSKGGVPTHFESQFSKFSIAFEEYRNPNPDSLKIQRAYRNYLAFKLEVFIFYIINKLVEAKQGDTLKVLLTLTKEDFYSITQEFISVEVIFTDILRIILNIAHEHLFLSSKPSDIYKDNALTVSNSQLQYKYEVVLAETLINATLNYSIEKKIIDIDFQEFALSIHNYLTFSKINYAFTTKIENAWGIHCDNAATILHMFEQSGVYAGSISEVNKDKFNNPLGYSKNFILPKMLELDIMKPLKFPNVTRPKDLNIYKIDGLIKPIIFGSSSVSKSENLIKALNYSQKKKFKISESFLKICKMFSELDHTQKLAQLMSNEYLDISFPTCLDIGIQRLKYHSKIEPKTSILSLYIANKIKQSIHGNTGIKVTNFSKLLILSGCTVVNSVVYLVKEKEKQKLNSLEMEAKYAYTTIKIATWFKRYPIYITDKLCLRLRMYPQEHWVSRTTGGLKHLLCDYTNKKLTINGLISLLKAYYAADAKLNLSFEKFLNDNIFSLKTGKKLLFNFFHENYLNFTTIKNALYFTNIHVELLKVEKSDYTSVNIEIDQTASGIVFLSLLLRDKKMAESANLIQPIRSCPYTFVMGHFKEFCESNMEYKSDKAVDFLSKSRKLHKYALMCFTYSQTHIGRRQDFIHRWIEETHSYPNKNEIQTLTEFAVKYNDFIEQIFPRTLKKLSLLQEAVELMCNECNSTSIRTLEGEVITWSFYKKRTAIRHRFDPILKESSSYSTVMLGSPKILDYRAHKTKFLSYLIHSIDAAVLRFYIRKFEEKYHYNINHLHDCIILHPNYVESFYDLVKELYSSDELYYMSETLVFDQIRSSLSSGSQSKLENIKAEYLLLCDNFKDCMKFDPKNIYKFED